MAAKPLLTSLLFAALIASGVTNLAQAETKTWDGGGDGTSWNDAANWDPDGVPAAGDDVVIAGGGTIDIGANPITINALTLSSKTLTGAGNLTINGLFTWNSGSIRTANTVTVNGTLMLATASQKTLENATFNLASNGTWADGNVRLDNGSEFNVLASRTLTITDPQSSSIFRGTVGATEPEVNIDGTVTKDAASTNITSFDAKVILSGTGTFNGAAGEINFGFASEMAGTLNPTGVGVIEIDASGTGQAHNFNTGSSVTGNGIFRITFGSVNFNDTHAIGAAFLMQNGTVNIFGTVNANGAFTWSAGTIGNVGTLNLNGGATFDTASERVLNGVTINLDSNGTWSDGNFRMHNASEFNVLNTRILTVTDIQASSFFRGTVGATEPSLNISGQITKSIGSVGITSLDVKTVVSGTGAINALAGEMNLGFASEIAGTLTPTSPGTIEIDNSGTGQAHNFNTGADVTGNGTFRITFGTVNFNDTHDIAAAFHIQNGTVNVFGTVNSNGPFTWSAGTVGNVGTVNMNGGATFDSASQRTIAGTTLNLDSDGMWSDGNTRMENASKFVIFATRTLTVTDPQASSFIRGTVGATEPELTIHGTIDKTAGSVGITSLDVKVIVSATGEIATPAGEFNLGFASEIAGTLDPTATGTIEIDNSGTGQAHNFNTGAGITGNGTFRVGFGTVNFNDTHAIAASFHIANGTVNIFGTVNANGPFIWSTGTVGNVGTLNMNGGATFDTSAQRTIDGTTLNLDSDGTWADGNFRMETASEFNILPTRILTVTDTQAGVFFRGVIGATEPELMIAGTLTKSAGSVGITSLDVKVVVAATGKISAPAGEINLGYASEIAGSFDPTAIGIIEIDASGTGLAHNFNTGSSVTGNGLFRIAFGTTNFNDTHTIAASFHVQNGTVNIFDTVNANGPFTWSAGTIGNVGTLNINGGATFDTAFQRTIAGATINLASDGEWSDGTFRMENASVFDIFATRTLTVTDPQANNFVRGTVGATEPELRINGTLAKSAGSVNITSLDVIVIVPATGEISAPAGEVNLGYASEIAGTFDPTAIGTIEIDFSAAARAHNFNAGSSVTGDGTFRIAAGTVNFNDTHAIAASFHVQFGTVNVFVTVNVNGPFTWSGGTIGNVGTVNLNGGATFDSASQRTLDGATINLASAGTMSDGNTRMEDASKLNILASNTLTVTDPQISSFHRGVVGATEPRLTVDGTFAKSAASAATTSVDIEVVVSTTGLVTTDAGFLDFGFTTSNHGTMLVGTNAEIEFDFGTHTNETDGTIGGDGVHRVPSFVTFNNLGTYSPGSSTGSLGFIGDYSQQQSTTNFNVEIGGATPGTQFDVLEVTGPATLGGTITSSLVDGFTPANGQQFVVLTASDGVNGTFTNENTPGFVVAYNPNNVTLTRDAQEVADLAVAKSVSASAVDVGSDVTFTVTLTNNGPNAATSITVNDLLPAGLTFSSATPSTGSYNDTDGNWTVASLANGANATLEIVATVTTAGTKTNTAAVTGADQSDNDSSNNSASAQVTGIQVDIALAKTVNNASPDVGQDVTFTVTASNNGPSDATGVEVTDQLPAGLTFQSGTPSQGAYNSTTGVWTVGNLANGANATLQIVATVDQTGTITNTATLTAVDQPDGNPGNDAASAPISSEQANLAVTKSASDATVNVNDNVTFTVTVTNNGPSNATGVSVTDQLPAGLTHVSNTPSQGAYDIGTGVWTVGNIANGANATLQIVAQVDATGDLTNTAAVTAADQPDPDAGDNSDSATVTGLQVDIALAKTVDNPSPDVGQNVTFTVTASNSGPSDATGVQVTDQLPAGLTFQSSTPSQGAYNSATGIWTVGNIANGANATLQIVARVDQSGAITNTASVTAVDQPDSDGSNDTASRTIAGAQADLEVSKTASAAQVTIGDNVTFTVTVSNNGPSDATGVSIADQLPAGLAHVSNTPSQGAFDTGTGVWTVGDIANGANATLTIVATVGQAGDLTNTASVSASDQADPDASNDSDSATVTGLQVDIGLTKTVDNAAPTVGANVTFTVTVRNNGPGNATGVEVTDVLPAGLGFVSATAGQGAYASGTGIWSVGALASGAETTLQIVARADQEGALTNTANVTGVDQPDSDDTNDSASQVVTVGSGGVTISGVVLDVSYEQPAGKSITFVDFVETPLQGVLVELFADGQPIGTRTTDVEGAFSFDQAGKTQAQIYQLRFLGVTTVPESGEAIEVRKIVDNVQMGSATYRLPVRLFAQKHALIYLLTHLTMPPPIGTGAPMALSSQYDESGASALLDTWAANVGTNRPAITEALTRLWIAEYAISLLYDDAVWMSHETSYVMFKLVKGFLIAQSVAAEIQDNATPQLLRWLDKNVVEGCFEGIEKLYRRVFLEEPMKRALANLPANCGPTLQQSVQAMANAATATDLIKRAADVSFMNDVIKAGSQRILSWYVRGTQEDLDRSVDAANRFDYSGTADAGYSAMQQIVQASREATLAAHETADVLQSGTNYDSVHEKILSHVGREANVGNYVSLSRQIRNANFGGKFGQSVALTMNRLKEIERVDLPGAIAQAFNPAVAKQPIVIVDSEAEGRAAKTLDALRAATEPFRQKVAEIVTAFNEGRRDDAFSQYGALIDLDGGLESALFASQAPILAAAEAASGQVADFDSSFDALTDAVSSNQIERAILYAQLLQITDDPNVTADSISAQADAVVLSLDNAENGISTLTAAVQGVQARPYVAVSEIRLATNLVGLGDTLRVRVTVENQGGSAADGVSVTMVPDEAAVVLGSATVDAGMIGASESRTFNWDLRIVDETRVLRTFQIELTSENALTIPGTGTYNVGLSVAVEEIGGEVPSSYSLDPSYPNPFNPSTSITFSVPVSGHVMIRVFDILGREVSTLVDEVVPAGQYQTTFDAGRLPSGAYLYRMEAGDFVAVRSTVLVK